MATVSTETGTYLSNLFNPQVVADLINTKLTDKIVLAPLATIDNTLTGRAGDTVTLPFYAYSGMASEVEEGHDIPIDKLTQSTKSVKIEKIGKGKQLTDEAVLSGYGDPLGTAVEHITTAIADKLDNKLLAAAARVTTNIYQPEAALAPSDIPMALSLFGEDNDGTKVLIVDPNFYAKLLKIDWIPASEIAADVRVRGVVGMAYGCQVVVSNRVKNGNFYIMKPGALAVFMKRDTLVEMDRDIVNQSTVVVGSKLFAPYVLNENYIVKIVNGLDDGLAKIGLTAAAGTEAGDTKLTVTYTPGSGESYKIKVGDAADNVALGEAISGYTSWNGSADITAAAGKVITVVSVDGDGKAVAAGSVVSVPHA